MNKHTIRMVTHPNGTQVHTLRMEGDLATCLATLKKRYKDMQVIRIYSRGSKAAQTLAQPVSDGMLEDRLSTGPQRDKDKPLFEASLF